MISEFDIRQHVARYLGGQSDLRQLNASLAPMRFGPDNALDLAAEAILSQLEGRLAEYSHGDWTEPELQDLLIPFGGFVVTDGPAPARFGSNASVVGPEPAFSYELVTTRS